MAATLGDEFAGNARFEVRRRLGAGGMGVVYHVEDRERGVDVALKTIGRSDPDNLYRFKKEFRALEDVSHPNLVRLWELFSDGGSWFFTMELVDGTNFLSYISIRGPRRPGEDPGSSASGPTAADAGPTVDATAPGVGTTVALSGLLAEATVSTFSPLVGPTIRIEPSDDPSPTVAFPPPKVTRTRPFHEARLRSALVQLARGLITIHSMGRLHRDIKSSNVMVDRQGRVVVLDFGLSIALAEQEDTQATENQAAGTVTYMAPEQANGESLTPASDWYSVGVLLYVALTGQLPFTGSSLQVLIAKQRDEPSPPWSLVDGLPTDLGLLCMDLLHRSPGRRPTGEEVLRRLGAEAEGSPTVDTTHPAARRPFVGRETQLRAIAGAYRAVDGGQARAVFVRGRSGAGKSALVRHFLGAIDPLSGAVVLEGRCFEQESVAYKAFDTLIDSLSRYLRRLDRLEAEAVLPRDVAVLARLFPVLRRVEAVAGAPQRSVGVLDPQELRRRAFAALRELLARIGDRGPLILVIDDLQWGDLDSADLLAGLLGPPDAPSLLLLACYRSEYAQTSRCLTQLLGAGGGIGPDRVDVEVAPLSHDEARDLARRLLADAGEVPEGLIDLIARESGGSPYYVAELVQYLVEGNEIVEEPGGPASLRLDDVLWHRIRALPPGSRRLLEAIAVAGQPLGQALACRAAGLGAAEGYDALTRLRANNLVHGKGLGLLDEVEAYHDRVRETVAERLTPDERRHWHAALAAELEESGAADAETLAVHFEGAGNTGQAAHYCGEAAARAAEALAFDRAAALYRRTLEFGGEDAPGAADLWRRLGEALSNAGRGAEAAVAFLAAAARSDPGDSVALRGRAAYLYLMSGHIDEGLTAFREVLDHVGVRQPRTPLQALCSVLAERVRLRVRGLRPAKPPATGVDPDARARVEVVRGVAVGMSVNDVIQGAYYQTRSLRMALKLGDPTQIALTAGWEAVHSSTQGWPARRRTQRLIALSQLMAAEGDPHALGMATLGEGSNHYFNGRFPQAVPILDRAAMIFREQCTGVTWELDTTQTFATWAHFYQGELAEMGRRFLKLNPEAQARGDRYMEATLGVYPGVLFRLAADDPGGARELADKAIAGWTHNGFHVQHLNHFYGLMYAEMYQGDFLGAWERAERTLPEVRRSLLQRVEHVAIDVLQLRARAALGTLGAPGTAADRARFAAITERLARQLDRHHRSWGRPVATLVRAGLAHQQGQPQRAVDLLREGIAQAEALSLGLFAAGARRHLGSLLGGDEGRAEVDRADAWMAHQTIRDPARMAHSFVPGFARA